MQLVLMLFRQKKPCLALSFPLPRYWRLQWCFHLPYTLFICVVAIEFVFFFFLHCNFFICVVALVCVCNLHMCDPIGDAVGFTDFAHSRRCFPLLWVRQLSSVMLISHAGNIKFDLEMHEIFMNINNGSNLSKHPSTVSHVCVAVSQDTQYQTRKPEQI